MSRFRPSRNYVSGKVVFEGGPVDITGDLVVSGSITANQYNVNVINTNVTHMAIQNSVILLTIFTSLPDLSSLTALFLLAALSEEVQLLQAD